MVKCWRLAGIVCIAIGLGAPSLARATERPRVARADSAGTYRTADSLRVYVLDPVRVQGRIDDLAGFAASASEGRIGRRDLARRPLLREGEILEAVPGLVLTQHSGDGKSNQMFLRGFNLDHGTDFRTELEGMPLNMPSHGHGQGYTDLNFLVPEVIDHIEFKKGTYYAEIGDFGSTGGAHLHLARALPRSFVKMDLGSGDFVRFVGAGSEPVGGGHLLVAAELKGYDGPWDLPQDLAKRSGLGRYTWKSGAGEFSLLAMAYANRWESTDQIPRRAIRSGAVSRFGQVDSTLGGRSSRYSLSGSWTRNSARSRQRAGFYAVRSELQLFSNFTYFLDDASSGDQFEQVDRRIILGGGFDHAQSGERFGARHRWSLGLQLRCDLIPEVGLHRTRSQQRLRTIREDDVRELSTGIYASARSEWHPRFRTELGLRGDVYVFDVESSIAANSGNRSSGRVSPKAALLFEPRQDMELYLNGGMGFHSNDARGTTQKVDPMSGEPVDAVDPLVASRGGELGLRWRGVAGLRSTLSLWWLDLDSELLYVGDAGNTEPTYASRRIGFEWANFYRPLEWLAIDADLALSRARFRDAPSDADRIPGALEHVLSAGLAVGKDTGASGALRLRHLGEYPLREDGSPRAQSTTVVNAGCGYGFAAIRFEVSLLNLLGTDDNDIQYYYASRLSGEAEGVDDVHLHPVEPRSLRGSMTWSF